MSNDVTRFGKVSPGTQFYFVSFSIETIENTEFLKINVLDIFSNTIFAIYKQNKNDSLFDYISSLNNFDDIDDKIFVVYKNGRLKFDIRD